ncbi:lysozyme C-like [Pelodiscus sinensis]|uniref:lysozyme C-like n=1 Tax=Pelodiscus sinensis TaxID=13735 RepID=UPI003F6CD054
MKSLLLFGLPLLLLLAVAPPGCRGVRIDRCKLIRMLKKHGMEGFVGKTVADWVCLVQHESNYNTNVVSPTRDYGIFQINSRYWCNDGRTKKPPNVCRMPCSKLLDNNIEDDIRCAKIIAKQSNGLTPWVAWRRRCKGKNLKPYVKGC